MRLAFSTLGCPAWGIEQMLGTARAQGYAGVELRFYEGSLDLLAALAAFPGGPGAFARRCAEAGVEVPCLDSSVVLSKAETEIADGKRMIDLAQQLGAPFLRVFGGAVPEGESFASCQARAADKLARLGAYGATRGVRVLLETHDAFSTGEAAAGLLAAAGEDNLGVIWDVHHPHAHGEPLPRTLECIGPRTYHVHVKDGAGGKLTLLGEGEMPLRAQLTALRDLGYRGYLSFEWEKAWVPELEEPEVAFPHAARALKKLCAELRIELA